jgi:hypothetical protein
MQKNIGMIDRFIRLVLAIGLLAYAWWQWSWIALILSLFVFFEVFFSWCLVYQLLGRNTCPVKKKTNHR